MRTGKLVIQRYLWNFKIKRNKRSIGGCINIRYFAGSLPSFMGELWRLFFRNKADPSGVVFDFVLVKGVEFYVAL